MNFELLSNLSRFATPEVAQVIGCLFTAWIGWKVAAKGFGLISNLAQRVSFIGLASAVFCFAGLGSMGLGVGELASRWLYSTPSVKAKSVDGLKNSDLNTLAQYAKDEATTNAVLNYARQRDGLVKDSEFAAMQQLVEKQLRNSSGDSESNNKLLMSLIEYAKEAKKNAPQEPLTLQKNDTPVMFASYKESYDGKAVPEIVKDNNYLSVPAAFSLMGVGIAFVIVSLACNERRLANPTPNMKNATYKA